MHTGNDGAFETAAASGEDGVRLSSSARSSSQPVLVTFLMVKHLLSGYKPLTILQSFDKVDSDSFCQDSQCYRETPGDPYSTIFADITLKNFFKCQFVFVWT